MLSQLTNILVEFLKNISGVIPLPLFTFLGSFIEEIVAPIPSPLVMTLAGTLAAVQQHNYGYLGFLALIAAIGKTIASYLLYVFADKGEDIVLNKFGRLLGVSHEKVESIGSRLNKGWKDDVVLILLRAVPIIPSSPVSIICGLIKLNTRTFITSTFIGTVIRNIFYLIFGYMGVNATEAIIVQMENYKFIGYIVIFLLIVFPVCYLYLQKHRDALINKLFQKK